MGIDATATLRTTTMEQYIIVKSESLYQYSPFLEEMRRRGRVVFNKGGNSIIWHPTVDTQAAIPGTGTGIHIDFAQPNNRIKCELPWRHYQLGTSIEPFEIKANRGNKEKLYDIRDERIDSAMEGFGQSLAAEPFKDGNAGNANTLHGFASCTGNSGSCLTGVPVAVPSDTYAGQSTALAALGGSWGGDAETVFPVGSGDLRYHAFSPLIVDYQNDNLAATTKSWANTWQESVRYAFHMQKMLLKINPGICIISPRLMLEAMQSLESKQTIEMVQTNKVVNIELTPTFGSVPFLEDVNCRTARRWWSISTRCSSSAWGRNWSRSIPTPRSSTAGWRSTPSSRGSRCSSSRRAASRTSLA